MKYIKFKTPEHLKIHIDTFVGNMVKDIKQLIGDAAPKRMTYGGGILYGRTAYICYNNNKVRDAIVQIVDAYKLEVV